MVTASVMNMDVVLSVHRPLSLVGLYLPSAEYYSSSDAYAKIPTSATSLPRIDADLKVLDNDCKALVRMIIDHNMVGKLAVYLLHSQTGAEQQDRAGKMAHHGARHRCRKPMLL
ncbi:hypothetical protein GQ44DRAFT_716492 [Phaeosphaeriaceae sp. PMI808]|nr:hypothetical protein GQ44DRAFT_716492 [Phaeosphaeriaceae sp. PMI808]